MSEWRDSKEEKKGEGEEGEPDNGDEEAAVRVAVDEHAVAGHLLLDEDHALGACIQVRCICICIRLWLWYV